MSATLRAVTRATKRRDTICGSAYAAYLDAIRTARAAGHSVDDIAQAAGLSRQGVYYLLNGDKYRQPK